VTDNYSWPACEKAVFTWRAEARPSGMVSLAVKLYRIGDEDWALIANDVAFDQPDGLTGQTLEPLEGGEYYFAIENTAAPWSILVECQDGQPGLSGGIDLSGDRDTVSPNYFLPRCSKSVFVWSSAPSSSGLAALIVKLYKVGGDRPTLLVNALEFNVTAPITGEALALVMAGVYYLEIYNNTGQWTVRWECRD